MVAAERFDGFGTDAAAIDGEALCCKSFLDVARRYGSVQSIALADGLVDGDFDAGKLLSELFGGLLGLGSTKLGDSSFVLDARDVLFRGAHSEPSGDEKVASVAGTNANEFAALADVGKFLGEDDAYEVGHDVPLFTR